MSPGWIAQAKGGRGPYGKLADFKRVTLTAESLPICTISSFTAFWEKEFPLVKIKNCSHDTCTLCYLFEGKLSGLRRRERHTNMLALREEQVALGVPVVHLDGADMDMIEHEQGGLYNQICHTIYDGAGDDNDFVPVVDDSIDSIVDERDLLLLKMSEHVKEWKCQRDYVQLKRDESKADLANDIKWPNRRDCFVGDYSQNMGLPWFGNEQPGVTYYYSPLGVYVFGMANYATEHLHAYVYDEGEGAKGGNNVCSLVYKHLVEEGIIKEWEDSGKVAGESCTFVFDNCAGQNKNRMMLRLPMWLVDMGIYKKVQVVFLVAGHTKNICDRRFKDMKKECHNKDIISLSHLIDLMRGPFVTPIKVTSDDFKDWDKMLDANYKNWLATLPQSIMSLHMMLHLQGFWQLKGCSIPHLLNSGS